VLSAGLCVWEENLFSVYYPVQIDDESIWIPVLRPAGAVAGAEDHGGAGAQGAHFPSPRLMLGDSQKQNHKQPMGITKSA